MKLGEHLVRNGTIDAEQLETALSDQLVHGGHLGTCLIERHFIDETSLGHALAEISGMPYAAPRVFRDIPPSTIKTVPFKLVTKHSVVPFRLTGNELDVAMVDPKDLAGAASARCPMPP